MELSARKKKILRAIVDLYIRTAEPVASKTIAQMPDMDFSSATIRNEMAELTTLGYLEQPHTSAGRIPSPAGYRLYVDELMQDYRLSTDETKSINQAMELKMQEVDKVVSQVGKLVSQMTNLPAYAMAARAAGVDVYDTPFTDVDDDEGLRADAEFAKSLGFTGKASISPRHLEGINACFSPTQAEADYAREVLEAIEEGVRQGKGAVALRGKMIDAPVVARARQTLEAAEEIIRRGGTLA